MNESTRKVLESADFKKLVAKRWLISILFLIFLFIIYYGYILLIAYDKALLATKIGVSTTLGIPMGVAVIVLAWLITFIYVMWANNSYDPDVDKLKKQLKP